jgi:FkbM family methyltransferase
MLRWLKFWSKPAQQAANPTLSHDDKVERTLGSLDERLAEAERLLGRLAEQASGSLVAMHELGKNLTLTDERAKVAEMNSTDATERLSRQVEAVRVLVMHLESIDECAARTEAQLIDASQTLSNQIEAVRLFASRVEPIDERSARTEAYLLNATERLSKQVEEIRVFASRIEPIDVRSARTEAHLLNASGALSKQIEAVRLFASRVEPIDERSARTEAYLLNAIERLSKQIEEIRVFASRIEPIDVRSARTEAHLLNASGALSKQIEAVRLFASRIEPIDKRSTRIEVHLLDASSELLKQIEAIRLFASRIEPIDERSARTEGHLLDATETLSKQIETVRLFASRIEPIENYLAEAQKSLTNLLGRLSQQADNKEAKDPTSQSTGSRPQRSSGYDLVNLHEIFLFVPVNDNLYDKFIPHHCKGFSLEQCRAIAGRTSALSVESVSRDVGAAMLLYLELLFQRGLSVHMIDIGAWVGDIAIRYAKFAQARGASFFADCYDPSDAGALIPRNIALNGLRDFVAYRPFGVSLKGGPLVFDQLQGNSDSSRLAATDNSSLPASSYLVDTVTLAECLAGVAPHRHVMVKIDVEGIDALLVLQNLKALRYATLIVEFSPQQEQYAGRPDAFIKQLIATHSLFDLYYLPNPGHVVAVEDVMSFVKNVSRRSYGYTDILAVPHALPIHDDIARRLACLVPAEPNYQMA